MYFFCPSITQWSPTRRARVRRPAGLDPAPGSTRAATATATAATISQEAIRVGPSFFCASVPKPTRTWPAMPLLVPDIDRCDSAVEPNSCASSTSWIRSSPIPPHSDGLA
ncbi:MAG: hypothetical protein QOG20_2618 [Pseudonocardiales bacterium]|nr:hypothetical protein [Pseudonocardiales bacterium]